MQAVDFPYTHDFKIIFHHLDVLGHVNNVQYLRFLETARIEYMQMLFNFEAADIAPFVIGDMYCRYIAPAFYHDVLTVGCGISRFGTKSFDFVYAIDAQDGRRILTAKSTMVAFDKTTQRSIVVPDVIREGVAAFQGAWDAATLI